MSRSMRRRRRRAVLPLRLDATLGMPSTTATICCCRATAPRWISLKRPADTKNSPSPRKPNSILSTWRARRAGGCGRTPGKSRGGFSRRTGGCRRRPGWTISPWQNCCSPNPARPCGRSWRGDMARRLWDPIFVSALNTAPEEASATLAATIVRETFAGRGPRLPPGRRGGGPVRRLRRPRARVPARQGRAHRLWGQVARPGVRGGPRGRPGFRRRDHRARPRRQGRAGGHRAGGAGTASGLSAPTEFRSIVNAHFALPAPKGMPLLTGVVGGWSEWVFAFPDRLSVTISAAERSWRRRARNWRRISGRRSRRSRAFRRSLPPWQIIKEKRATFAATPAQDALRPGQRRAGAIWSSPETGRKRACPRPSKARSAPVWPPRGWPEFRRIRANVF